MNIVQSNISKKHNKQKQTISEEINELQNSGHYAC